MPTDVGFDFSDVNDDSSSFVSDASPENSEFHRISVMMDNLGSFMWIGPPNYVQRR